MILPHWLREVHRIKHFSREVNLPVPSKLVLLFISSLLCEYRNSRQWLSTSNILSTREGIVSALVFFFFPVFALVLAPVGVRS